MDTIPKMITLPIAVFFGWLCSVEYEAVGQFAGLLVVFVVGASTIIPHHLSTLR